VGRRAFQYVRTLKSQMAVMFRAGAVVAYAAAMGYAEAAAVAYLRQALVGSSAGQLQSSLMRIESGREAATIVMLATVGGIAGRTWSARFSYLTIAFGVWDITYYGFFHLLVGWPPSLATWDELFLLPVPWFGPVWAPAVVSLILIGLGARLLAPWPQLQAWQILMMVAAAALVFVSFTVQVEPGGGFTGSGAGHNFLWPVFTLGVALGVLPLMVGFRLRPPDERRRRAKVRPGPAD
jgi:hypothetical protein